MAANRGGGEAFGGAASWRESQEMPTMAPATTPDPLLGVRSCTDGSVRPVYLDEATGKQYVLDDEGEPLYGVWLHPEHADTPAAITATAL
jgi:hypothetical protein